MSSRLSRDGPEAQITLRLLEFLGVKFVARADGIDTATNPKSSRLLYGIKAAMNEEFLRDLAEKTHRGLEGQARKGYSTGGLPYGYRTRPVQDARGQVIGHERVIHEAEAEVVRRIFRLAAGDEGARPLSSREIADLLNREGVAPPGSRWPNRTVRQGTTWSYTAIIGHRRLRKGILNNPLYVGQVVWNRSEWMRHPITKRFTYRIRPKDDWIEREVPELRIVPQDLWNTVQARLSAFRSGPMSPPAHPRFHKYLLSGFVTCAECGGHYVISTAYSYRCGTYRNRGAMACSNHLTISRRKLERAVAAALRDHLYTEENIAALVAEVRDALRERARQHSEKHRQDDRAHALRQVQKELANIKEAIKRGIITDTTREMLLEAEKRRDTLTAQESVPDHTLDRLARVLDRLPEFVRSYLDDLDTLLASEQIDRGKAILQALDTTITLYPCGEHLEAEIGGKLERLLVLEASKARGGFNSEALCWLGEEDSNRFEGAMTSVVAFDS